MGREILEDPLLGIDVQTISTTTRRHDIVEENKSKKNRTFMLCLFLFFVGISGLYFRDNISEWLSEEVINHRSNNGEEVVSENGVVAADHEECSKIGAAVLGRDRATAVDAAVATAFCLGVVNPTSSGIGGGAFMIIGSSEEPKAQAYDMRETAPSAASQDMYKDNEEAKSSGALSIGVPGEIAGLYKAWEQNNRRVEWKSLVEPAINLARGGSEVGSHLAYAIATNSQKILKDEGLRKVFAPKDTLLSKGDKCYNLELAESLEAVAEQGPKAFYDGTVGEKLVRDVREAGGIITMDDLRKYRVRVTDALSADVMGYTMHGMPPPSSGTVSFSMVLNIFDSYAELYAADKNLGLHRLIEAIKHMLTARMDLGDPEFVNTNDAVEKMLSKSHAKEIWERIRDNTTFPPDYYLPRWSQLRDLVTSHFCIMDKYRNVVSMPTTVFGSGFLSPSTGIILNNQMADFSIPTENTPDRFPPAPANYIKPNKRPLSSMTPLIIKKDGELIGVIGASGGLNIAPAVIQVFLNHFVLGMKPLEAVRSPRVYHRLIPNKVQYEDWRVYNGEHIELEKDIRKSLEDKHLELEATDVGATVQFVVQSRHDSKTLLTAVSDLRKDGKPAAVDNYLPSKFFNLLKF